MQRTLCGLSELPERSDEAEAVEDGLVLITRVRLPRRVEPVGPPQGILEVRLVHARGADVTREEDLGTEAGDRGDPLAEATQSDAVAVDRPCAPQAAVADVR